MHASFALESPTADGVAELFAESDAYGLSLYPSESYYALDPATFVAEGARLLVARVAGAAIAMGAVVPTGDGIAELKRMWVAPAHRGRGLASELLRRLEALAQADGVTELRLETGPLQPDAIRLYERHGYARIPNFGPYVGDELSVCFAKRLASARDARPATAPD